MLFKAATFQLKIHFSMKTCLSVALNSLFLTKNTSETAQTVMSASWDDPKSRHINTSILGLKDWLKVTDRNIYIACVSYIMVIPKATLHATLHVAKEL